MSRLEQISDGRTDQVFDYVAEGHAANSTDAGGVSLIQWCAYYGDVSAIRFLLSHGESLSALGDNLAVGNNVGFPMVFPATHCGDTDIGERWCLMSFC